MKTRTSALAAALAVLALLVSACGGDGRPSADELSERIQEDSTEGDEITEEQADCLAEEFHDSDISDDGLRTMIDSPEIDDVEELDISDDDKAAAEAAANAAFEACFSEG